MIRSILATLLVVGSLACRGDEKVAQIGGTIVTPAEVACPATIKQESCPAVRQEKLDRLGRALLIGAAARLHRVSISDQELNEHTVQVPEAYMRGADERLKRLAHATLLVRRGEQPDIVYERDLAPHGITREQFQSALAAYRDEAAALQALAMDIGRETRKQLAEQARQRLLQKKLNAIVAERSRARAITFEEAATEFWSDVVERSHTVVFDQSLHLPAMEGVLKP